ncbi:MAG: efflux RND transporter permease subunit, partial [Gammaproteobacteria bacterium]|nr:efflux RND transporter permease subunit [Gammaproteobacteria bacterium]
MKRVVSWFATNPVATNLLVAFLLLAGIASFARISVQIWPDLDVPVISIVVPYLGAAPEEVETAVCARIDEKLDGIEGVDRIRSTAEEGRCRVVVALLFDADRAAVLADVQNQVNAIDTLPKETETPVVQLRSSSDVVIEAAVTGPTDERDLKELARRVRNDLLALPAITRASVANVRPYEISVEVSDASLQRNQLTFDQVANAIRGNSLDLPGGAIKTNRGELLLRTQGQAERGAEFDRIEVTTRDDGTRVLLEDVARVVDGFADTGQEFRFDGRPAALIRVSQVGSQDLREIAAEVRRYVAETRAQYPEDVTLTVWNDQSSLLVDRLATLIDSGLQGLLLVLVVLALFLRPHLALWVAAGIPIALLGAVFLLFCFGVSIDAISLIGFIVVLGLLVDDAVVVGESAYVAQREGAGQLAGAIEGARRVFVPVTFGVLTTVAVFVPMLFLTGIAGQFMAAVAAPVICCLAFSLIECHVILPLHLGHRPDSMPLGEFGIAVLAVAVLAAVVLAADARDAIGFVIGVLGLVVAAHESGALRWLGAAFARIQVRFEQGLETFIQGTFRSVVRRALRRRALTVTSGVVAFGLAVAVVVGGHLPFSFLISDQGDRIVAKLNMPFGVPQHDTDRALGRLVASARALQ